jgi:hypothetical protein
MIVKLKQNGTEIEVDDVTGNLLMARDYAEAGSATQPAPHTGPTNYRKPVELESQAARNPALYDLRDKIANGGVPIAAANVLALEIFALREQLAGGPHLVAVERR